MERKRGIKPGLMLDAPDYPAILSVLARAQRPSRYLGTETNARRKAWQDASLRVCLIFPDLYEIGMSHLGLHILYHILNELPWAMADRAYCPAPDLEDVLRQKAIPIWGLESGRPLGQFDILAVTLPYELSSSNILTILDLAGVPLRSRDRKDPSIPLIIGGGSSASNPEPVAPFFDAILIGDGEEAIVEIAEAVRDGRAEGVPKRELLHALSRIEGIYVPEFSDARYGPDGSFREMVPLEPGAGPVRRRIVSDLAKVPFPDRPLVPFAPIVHDRLGVEIARGCTRGCRFCQAGIFYRPVRERPPGLVLDLMEQGLRASGFEEASFLSLSTGDYRCIEPVLAQVMARHQEDRVSVSLPSLRVGTLTPEIMDLVGKVRKTGFTLAPEAGSERMRKVINKGITEEELLATSERVFGLGWPGIKLYFMIGLPTETREDCLAIAELARKVLKTGDRGKTVTVSVGTFVPKPHTPFQWERQITVPEARERFELIRSAIRERAIKFKWHDPELSFLEGVFSRGDRRLASLVERAWRLGARLDAWSDHFRPDLYRKGSERNGSGSRCPPGGPPGGCPPPLGSYRHTHHKGLPPRGTGKCLQGAPHSRLPAWGLPGLRGLRFSSPPTGHAHRMRPGPHAPQGGPANGRTPSPPLRFRETRACPPTWAPRCHACLTPGGPKGRAPGCIFTRTPPTPPVLLRPAHPPRNRKPL